MAAVGVEAARGQPIRVMGSETGAIVADFCNTDRHTNQCVSSPQE